MNSIKRIVLFLLFVNFSSAMEQKEIFEKRIDQSEKRIEELENIVLAMQKIMLDQQSQLEFLLDKRSQKLEKKGKIQSEEIKKLQDNETQLRQN
jgi:uncharacterized coiled-coil protein SlyX